MSTQVESLHVYPVKACRGVRVTSVEVAARGPARDRRWMIVDDLGKFVTQRTEPRLTLVRTALLGDRLGLSAPGAGACEIPAQHEGGDRRVVEVWGHSGEAARHAEGSAWISRFLGSPHHLVYMPDDHRRPVAASDAIVSFADGYPFLLVSRGSLDDLNRRLAQPLTMERFRPNVVVSGCPPFAEDGWRRIRISGVPLRGVERCDRCSVTTVDPDTGERGREPLATLATFREQGGRVWFGMNFIHEAAGTLREGAAVEVTEGG